MEVSSENGPQMYPEKPQTPNAFNTVRILEQFEPFFRIINAYNANNFSGHDWRSMLSSICDAFYVTLGIVSSMLVIVLQIWDLIENNAEANKFVVSFPILVGLLMEESVVVEVVWNSAFIIGTIERLQAAIDKR